MAKEIKPSPESESGSPSDHRVTFRDHDLHAERTSCLYQQKWECIQLENDFPETVIHASRTLVLVLDLDGRILHFNRIVEEITGYRLNEVRGMDCFSIFLPEHDSARMRALFLRSRGEVLISENVTPVITFDNKKLYVEWSGRTLRNKEGVVVGMLTVGRDITQRRLAEARMQASLQEKEVLLREVCHRTRNTMQIISALTALQCSSIKDEKVLRIFRRIDNRIKSLALVHQMLYQADSVCEIDLKPCLEELVRILCNGFDDCRGRVQVTMDLDSLPVTLDTAIPCGLILNEAVSNCMEYAFPEGSGGKVHIELRSSENHGEACLRVWDDGVGFSSDLKERDADSLGMQLMTHLAEQQLNGNLKITSGGGTEVRLTFKNCPK